MFVLTDIVWLFQKIVLATLTFALKSFRDLHYEPEFILHPNWRVMYTDSTKTNQFCKVGLQQDCPAVLN